MDNFKEKIKKRLKQEKLKAIRENPSINLSKKIVNDRIVYTDLSTMKQLDEMATMLVQEIERLKQEQERKIEYIYTVEVQSVDENGNSFNYNYAFCSSLEQAEKELIRATKDYKGIFTIMENAIDMDIFRQLIYVRNDCDD